MTGQATQPAQRFAALLALGVYAVILAILILLLAASRAGTGEVPIVTGTAASQVTETSATLLATVNPGGRKTIYHFEYIDQAGFEAEEFAAAAKTTEESVPAGSEDTEVSAPLGGLSPATTYHYRAVAANSLGEIKGPPHTFSTYAVGIAGLPDARAYEQVTRRTRTAATPQARPPC